MEAEKGNTPSGIKTQKSSAKLIEKKLYQWGLNCMEEGEMLCCWPLIRGRNCMQQKMETEEIGWRLSEKEHAWTQRQSFSEAPVIRSDPDDI